VVSDDLDTQSPAGLPSGMSQETLHAKNDEHKRIEGRKRPYGTLSVADPEDSRYANGAAARRIGVPFGISCETIPEQEPSVQYAGDHQTSVYTATSREIPICQPDANQVAKYSEFVV
jgi:hypothetical protein